jgi:hypothetical protein
MTFNPRPLSRCQKPDTVARKPEFQQPVRHDALDAKLAGVSEHKRVVRVLQGLVDTNTRPHFPFRIDVWDGQGNSIERHVAGLDDFETAVTAYWTACRRWPKAKIALRQEARIIEKSWEGSHYFGRF